MAGDKRISTGIAKLNRLIKGGFKDKSVNLVAGGPGSGKTIFSMQFLIDGMKKGEPAIYVTFEEKKEKLYSNMKSFGWDLAGYEKKKLFTFLEYTPEQIKKVLVEGGGIIDSIITKTKAKRIVIDSITPFTLLEQDELIQKEDSLALFEMINKWGCTAVLTSQEDETNEQVMSAAIEFEVDSIILLYHTKVGQRRRRALEILKMRGTDIPERAFKMDIGKRGMAIKTG